MKLSKQQVEALASKIYRELKSEAERECLEFKKSEEYIEFKNNDPDCIFLNSLRIKYPNIYSHRINDITDDIKNKHFESLLPKIKNYPTPDSIENEIILETIECDSLDELIIKIKSKYD